MSGIYGIARAGSEGESDKPTSPILLWALVFAFFLAPLAGKMLAGIDKAALKGVIMAVMMTQPSLPASADYTAQRTYGVYAITAPDGKRYIGQSSWIERRWQQHRRAEGSCYLVCDSVREHGADAHTFEILAAGFYDEATRLALEGFFICFYKTMHPFGLNLKVETPCAKYSIATLKKMSAKAQARGIPEATREAARQWHIGTPPPNKGIPHSAETRALISANTKGKPKSAEWRAIMSARMTGENNPAKAEGVGAKISATLKGHAVSAQTRAKIAATLQGNVPWNKGKKTGLIPWNKGKGNGRKRND